MATQVATGPKKPQPKLYSVKEYLAFEEKAEMRHEFTNGKLTAMAGTSDEHNELCFNLTLLLKQLFPDCKVYMENVKLQLAVGKRYVYPDVFVTCDKRDFENRYIKAHPCLICEVTSLSTGVYDRTTKFLEYKKLKSLNHYLVVDQYNCHVEYFFKTKKGKWEMKILTQKSDVLHLESIGFALPLEKIYL